MFIQDQIGQSFNKCQIVLTSTDKPSSFAFIICWGWICNSFANTITEGGFATKVQITGSGFALEVQMQITGGGAQTSPQGSISQASHRSP